MTIEIAEYQALKLSISNLVKSYSIKYILKALGEVCLSKGDSLIVQGMELGSKDKWVKGETWCKIGKAILKLIS